MREAVMTGTVRNQPQTTTYRVVRREPFLPKAAEAPRELYLVLPAYPILNLFHPQFPGQGPDYHTGRGGRLFSSTHSLSPRTMLPFGALTFSHMVLQHSK